jgi:hypothetical protein
MASDEKRVVVIVPPEMADYLEKKAKASGMGNVSALLRYTIRQMMNDELLGEVRNA